MLLSPRLARLAWDFSYSGSPPYLSVYQGPDSLVRIRSSFSPFFNSHCYIYPRPNNSSRSQHLLFPIYFWFPAFLSPCSSCFFFLHSYIFDCKFNFRYYHHILDADGNYRGTTCCKFADFTQRLTCSDLQQAANVLGVSPRTSTSHRDLI